MLRLCLPREERSERRTGWSGRSEKRRLDNGQPRDRVRPPSVGLQLRLKESIRYWC